MRPVRYVVKAGDSLWSIAQTHYGDAGRWPDLYAYNNRPDIVAMTERPLLDPDRMVPGQALFLPPPRPRATQTRAASGRGPSPLSAIGAGNLPRPGGTALAPDSSRGLPGMGAGLASTGLAGGFGGAGARAGAAVAASRFKPNPAAATFVNDFAHVFRLDGETLEVRGAAFSASLHLYGTIALQRSARVPLTAYSSRSADIQARSQSALLLGQLLATQGTRLGWDPDGSRVAYESGLTRRAGLVAPSAALGQGVSGRGRPVLKARLAIPDFAGRIANHAYVARDLAAVIELTPGGSPAGTGQPKPGDGRRGEAANWLWAAAAGQSSLLVVGAVLDESAVTPGNGLADTAATLSGTTAAHRSGTAAQFLNAVPTPVRLGDSVRGSA